MKCPTCSKPDLTLRDRHILREMLMFSCSFVRGNVEREVAFERVIAKLVPKGPLPKLRKPLWKTPR